MKRLLSVLMGIMILLLSSTEGWSNWLESIEKDPGAVLKKLKVSAEQNDIGAQYWLGALLDFSSISGKNIFNLEGKQIPDAQAGIEWLVLASQQGVPDAQYYLGVRYDKDPAIKNCFSSFGGEGSDRGPKHPIDPEFKREKNGEVTIKWYKLAALQEDTRAQINLGWMYEKGEGVLKNYQAAMQWYKLADDLGAAEAGPMMAKLKQKISLLHKKSAEKLGIGHDVEVPSMFVDPKTISDKKLCPAPYDRNTWTDCVGSRVFARIKGQKSRRDNPVGDRYIGEWKNGLRHGEGVHYRYGPEIKTKRKLYYGRYQGPFKLGNRHGLGTDKWPNRTGYGCQPKPFRGKITTSYWVDDMQHGEGTITYTTGRVDKEYWKCWTPKSREKLYLNFNPTTKLTPKELKNRLLGFEIERKSKFGLDIETYDSYRCKIDNLLRIQFPDIGDTSPYFKFPDIISKLNLVHSWESNKFLYAKKPSPTVTAKKSPTNGSSLPPCPGSPLSYPSVTGGWDNCFGTYTFVNGHKYVGEHKDGKMHGQGAYTYTNGGKYVGEFKDNKRNGHFTVTYADGKKYVGEFRDDIRHGQGTETSANGDKYVGEFKDGKRNGQGTYYFLADNKFKGDKYVGEFIDDKKHGHGTYTLANGGKYVGEWKDGNPHGQGTETSANGDKYVGEYKDNKRTGQGTLTFAKGDKYVGEFRDGIRHGQGTYTYASGHKYVGEHKDGKPHGQGTSINPNGDKYVGEHKGTYHGQGTYTYARGTVLEGIFENGKFLYAKKVSPTVTAKNSSSDDLRSRLLRIKRLESRGLITMGEAARKREAILGLSSTEDRDAKAKATPGEVKPEPSQSGSGFFVSRLGHVITNQHIVSDCRKVTIGDSSKKQVTATVMETDRSKDLALLRISSMQMASVETKTLIQKLGIKVVPLATDGLMRSEDVELGEDVLVAGYPYGEVFSDDIKVNKGIVSGLRGMGDNTGQFQIDAAVQPGNSGGPIYDENGNIVGVVVSQLNKLKFAETVGSLPELVNFGIKASTVSQFLNASGLPTKRSKRSKSMSTRELAKIAKKQTVMVVCHQ